MAPLLTLLGEHLISVLRLAYRSNIRLFSITPFAFFESGKPYDIGFRVGVEEIFVFNPDLVRSLFDHSLNMREDIRLLVDGMDETIPLQYRFLSFYKLLENRFKKRGVWDSKALSGLLDRYRDGFLAASINGKPASELHTIRDKCAHIKSGSNNVVLGVTHLNHKEASRVIRILPVLHTICRDLVNDAAAGKFHLGPPGRAITLIPSAKDVGQSVGQAIAGKTQ